jgi:uncharacterized protein YeaC (DUF1315 family)
MKLGSSMRALAKLPRGKTLTETVQDLTLEALALWESHESSKQNHFSINSQSREEKDLARVVEQADAVWEMLTRELVKHYVKRDGISFNKALIKAQRRRRGESELDDPR